MARELDMAQTWQVNGHAVVVSVAVDVDDPDTPLLYVLRDNIGLRGPRARVYRLLHFGLARTGERSHRSGR
jgi:hypothetical protein